MMSGHIFVTPTFFLKIYFHDVSLKDYLGETLEMGQERKFNVDRSIWSQNDQRGLRRVK